jgi:replicative DNA helicase
MFGPSPPSPGDKPEGGGAFKGGGFSGKGRPERQPLEVLFGKPPPQAIEAEMALLGAMILDPRVTGDVIMLLKSPDLFYVESHRRIFQALITLYDKHQSGDLVQLLDALREDESVQQVGGTRYLEKLASETPGPAGAVHWARIVADKAKLRSLISTASDIVHSAYTMGQGNDENATEIIDKAEQQIFEIARKHELFDPQGMAELIQQEYDRLESQWGKGVSGVPTYYQELDKYLGGLQPGELTIIAARPSMGKTAVSLNLMEQIALGGGPHSHATGQRVPCGFFSLEMSKSAIVQRLLSSRSGVDLHSLRTLGEITNRAMFEDVIRRLQDAGGELHEAPIYIDDMPALTVMGLRARARRMVQQYGVRAIFIDYLQLMTAPAFARESRQVEVAAISRGIKALARELNMPIICLAQLNRGPESRGDNRPRMSDLRESGSIEQDADVVILLHREEYYHVNDPSWSQDPDNADKQGVAELIIAKQRNGPTGVVELKWDASTTRFKDLHRSGGGYADLPSGPPAPSARRPGGQANGNAGYAAEPKAPAGSGGYTPGGGYADTPASGGFTPAGPADPPKTTFSPGKKSGPISNHRDGGGPERPPFETDDEDEVGGLPI